MIDMLGIVEVLLVACTFNASVRDVEDALFVITYQMAQGLPPCHLHRHL